MSNSQQILLLRDRRNFTFSPATTPALHRGGSVVDLVRRERIDEPDLAEATELVGAGRHQRLSDLRVDEDRHGEPIPAGRARVDHAVRHRGDLAERVHLQHVTRVDDDRPHGVVGVQPHAVARLHLQARLVRRHQQSDQVDVLVITRTGHFGVRAVQRRVVDDAEQVLALGDPVEEEVRIATEVHGERLQDRSTSTGLERRVKFQSRGPEVRHLDRELVPNDRRRIVDVPEGHAVGPGLPHRDFGVRGREAHLVTLGHELVPQPLLQGHAGEEDLTRELESPGEKILLHAVSDDGDEAVLTEDTPERVRDFHVSRFVFSEAVHVKNGNTTQFHYPFNLSSIIPGNHAREPPARIQKILLIVNKSIDKQKNFLYSAPTPTTRGNPNE